MQPVNDTSGTSGPIIGIDRKELENLIRDSVQKEIAAQQSQKDKADAYIKRLSEIDAKATEYIQKATHETPVTYKLSIFSLIFGYIVATVLIFSGLFLAIKNVDNSGLFTIIFIFITAGIIWFISRQSHNLSKSRRIYLNNLAKLNIIFTSYLRQIHQMDSVFEGLVKNGNGITLQDAEQLLTNLQDVMTEALSAVTQTSNESDD